MRTLLFWLASLFLITVSGNLSTNLYSTQGNRFETSFSSNRKAHFLFDQEACESLNEFEEEDERFEETEKRGKKCGTVNSSQHILVITTSSENLSQKFQIYNIRNTHIHFHNYKVNPNAPPVIS